MAFRSREVMAHAVTTSRLLKNPTFALILRLLRSDFGASKLQICVRMRLRRDLVSQYIKHALTLIVYDGKETAFKVFTSYISFNKFNKKPRWNHALKATL